MPLQFQVSADLLSTVIILCSAFCIATTSVWFKNADELPRLLGYSMVSLFLFRFASLIIVNQQYSAVLCQVSEPLLLLLFTLVICMKAPYKRSVLVFILGLIPSVLFILVLFLPAISSSPSLSLACISASVVLSAILLYLLKNSKGDRSLVFWSIVPFLGASFAEFYKLPGALSFAPPLLWLTACAILLDYFYRSFYKLHLQRAVETEKKLADINRSINVEVKKRMLEIEKVNQNLLAISKTDSMSRVLNKAALLDSMDKLISSKPGKEFSIIMFDIDNFKNINDTLGHVVGDKCIKMLATTARNNIRDFDIIGRYGGDEFIIVLPDTTVNQAHLTAERFRRHVEASNSPHYTVSIGIASYPADGADVKALIEAADDGLYRSKRKGRNAISHKNYY